MKALPADDRIAPAGSGDESREPAAEPAARRRLRTVAAVTGVVDFDLHGLVGIRLAGAGPAEVRAVGRQLGLPPSQLDREPDITVRFVERIPVGEDLGLLGSGEAAFGGGRFLVLRGKRKTCVRVHIPFERIGQRLEILCERGLAAVPFLIPIVNLTALAKNVLPLHAAAFVYRETGVMVTGWSKGGKTETLLAFMARGARYVGDEWVYVPADGRVVYGIPEPVRLWDWHLTRVPAFRSRLSRGERLRMWTMSASVRLAQIVADRRGAVASAVRRVLPLLRKQACVDVPPERLFGTGSIALAGPLDLVVFVASHAGSATTVETADAQEVARRMVFSLQYERRELLAAYDAFRFAFPERRNELIEEAPARERALLERILGGKRVVRVSHPYPFALERLPDQLEPSLDPEPQALEPTAALSAAPELDWRFLLSNPELGRVLYHAANGSKLPQTLRMLGIDATALSAVNGATLQDSGGYDVVVLYQPDLASLRHAVAHLRPGGEIYVAARRTQPWSVGRRADARLVSTQDFARAARSLGLSDVRFYWHWPSLERCLEMVPLGEPAALLHALSRRGRGPTDRLKAVLARGAVRLGIMPAIVPAFGMIGRKLDGNHAD